MSSSMRQFPRSLCLAACIASLLPSGPLGSTIAAQGRRDPDWARLQPETLQHYQAIVRMDTSDPPGNEKGAADYLERVLTHGRGAAAVSWVRGAPEFAGPVQCQLVHHAKAEAPHPRLEPSTRALNRGTHSTLST